MTIGEKFGQWLMRRIPRVGRMVIPEPHRLTEDAWPRELTPSKLRAALSDAVSGQPLDQVEIFDNMLESDPRLRGIYNTRREALSLLAWEISATDESAAKKNIEEAGETDEDFDRRKEAAEYCTEVLSKAEGFDAALEHLSDAVGYSLAIAEIVWAPGTDGPRLSHFNPIDHRMVTADTTDPTCVRVFTIHNDATGEPIRAYPHKFIAHRRFNVGVSPFRGGLLRTVAVYHLMTRYGFSWWANDLETFGSPTTLAKYASGASEKEREDLWKMLTEVGVGRKGMFPTTTELEMIQRQGEPPHRAFLDWIQECETICLLGQTLTTQVGETGGAYATAKVHEQVRKDLLESDIRAEARTLRSQLLRSIVTLHFGPDWPIPYWRRIAETPKDLGQTADYIDKSINRIGIIPTKGWVSEELGIPLAPGENPDDPVDGAPPAPDFGGLGLEFGKPGKSGSLPGEPRDNPPADQNSDEDDGGQGDDEPMKKPARATMNTLPRARRTSPVRSLVGWTELATRRIRRQAMAVITSPGMKFSRARNLDDIAKALADHLESLPVDEFTDALRHYLMACSLFGYYVAAQAAARKAGRRFAAFAEPNLDLFSQPFEQAVRALSERLKLDPETFLKLDRQARSRAGRIAGQFNLRMVQDVYDAAEEIIEGGGTVRDFRLAVADIPEAKGWVGDKPWHADIVFRQNAAMSYGAGHLEAMRDAGVRKWRFTLYGPSCPICDPMDGMVFSDGDLTYYPPLHFNCDCYADPVFEDEDVEVTASSTVNNTAYFESQRSPGAFRYDPSQFGRIEPLNLSDVPPALRKAFADYARANGWEIIG